MALTERYLIFFYPIIELNNCYAILINYYFLQVILRNFDRHPYSIAVFEMKLYWSDWNDVSIFSCDKFTGKDIKKLVNETSEIYGLAVYHPALQPKVSDIKITFYQVI